MKGENKTREFREFKYKTPGWSLVLHRPTQTHHLITPLEVVERDIKKKLRTLPGVKDIIVADITIWKVAVGYQFFFKSDTPTKELYTQLANMFNLEIDEKYAPKKSKNKPAQQPPE